MFAITVTEKGGEQRRLDFDKPEITIGRVQGNDIILPKGNVSKRHARIVLKDGKFIIVDLKSTNGTYVNGRKITSPLVVKESDKIYIGDFILGVDEGGAGAGRSVESHATPPVMSQPLQPSGPLSPPPMGPMTEAEPPHSQPMPPMSRPMAPPASLAELPPPMSAPPMSALPMAPPMMPSMMPSMSAPPMAPSSSSSPLGQTLGGAGPSAPPGPALPLAAPLGAPAPRPGPRTSPPRPAPSSVAPPIAGPATTGSGPIAGSAPTPRPPAPVAPAVAPPSRPRLVGAGAAPGLSAAPAAAPRARPQAVAVARRASAIQPLDSKLVKQLEIQAIILERLVPKLGLANVALEKLGDEDLWQKAESAIVDLVETMDSSGELPKFIDQDHLIKDTLNEALGLGPLEDLLADDRIDEVLVDRRDRIMVGKAGELSGAAAGFSSDEAFQRVVERLVAPTGHRIDDAHPLIDVRLRDGSRLTAAVPPVAVRGACLTLRKPRPASFSLADLVGQGALSPAMAGFLSTCVAARKNMLVCGAPGAGKSSLLAALAAAAPDGERIVSVEEVAELAIGRDEWVALESRPSNGKSLDAIDLVSLVRGALRMRPDRLVVGDVRGGEAYELIQAMASSADGTLASVSGEGAHAALARLATMARLGAPGASADAMRELAAAAVDVVIHVARYADGQHRVASVEVVEGAGAAGFQTQELFGFRGAAAGGSFVASGVVPGFYAELEARGIAADSSIFRP